MCCRYETVATNEYLWWATDEQMDAVSVMFPKSHGVSRIDDRAVLSAIVQVLRSGVLWRDVPADYRIKWKTVYNRFVRWSQDGVMDATLCALTEPAQDEVRLVVSADDLLRHRSGELWADRGFFPGVMSLA
ncbi:transposase [Acetobacter fallax]|uniref:Transposase n=1 Tax=Acetobacter fallax TaxID=1737473 RepID=A0ABX0KA56_9PROT|nr:transposase [Acetobacter fallax]NHO33309.1 transposase [Acetobacter fallax]NHO36930.1 transposase [Acetobacter fallax]